MQAVSRVRDICILGMLKIQCVCNCCDSDVGGKHCITLDISRNGCFILCELTIASAMHSSYVEYIKAYSRSEGK